jgi:acyl-coenzyme A thioesterase PaaI-like protein
MKIMEEDERRRAARGCFGCGDLNPKGLKLSFQIEDGVAVAEFDPEPSHQGYPGLMHGGVVAAVLDEAMGWAIYSQGIWAMTARMQLRFRQSVPLARRLRVSAHITKQRLGLVEARAELRDTSGTLLAEGEGAFLRVTPEKGRELEELYRAAAETNLSTDVERING